jgi:hypothetical protein
MSFAYYGGGAVFCLQVHGVKIMIFSFFSSFVPDVSGQALTKKKQLSAAIS